MFIMPDQFIFNITAIAGGVAGAYLGIALWNPIHRAVDRLALKVWPHPAPNPADRIDLPAPRA